MATKQEMEAALQRASAMYPDGDYPPEVKQLAMAYRNGEWDQPQQAPQQGQDGNIMNSLVEGALWGGSGEAAGFGAAVTDKAAGIFGAGTGRPFGEVYTGVRDEVDADRGEYEERHPVRAFAAEMAGNAVTDAIVSRGAMGKLAPNASRARRYASEVGLGSAMAGAYGAMSAEEGERFESGRDAALLGGIATGVMSPLMRRFEERQEVLNRAKEALNRGDAANVTARFKPGPGGKPVPDPAGRAAVSQGVDEGLVASIKAAPQADKAAMRRMVSILEKRMENRRYGVLRRPSDVAGETVAKRYRQVLDLNQEAAQRLRGEAEKLRGQRVDVQPAVGEFLSDLRELGVTFDGAEGAFDFAGSSIEGVKAAENLLNAIGRRMTREGVPDAYDTHMLKRFIDEHVSYGKNAEGLTGQTEIAVKRLRSRLDEALDSKFDDYRMVNEQYSDTISALDELQALSGRKVDLTGPHGDKALGTLARRLTSNAQSRVPLLQTLDELDAVGQKYGLPMEGDVITQVMFIQDLEDKFGAFASSSFMGDIEKGVKQGMTQVLRDKAATSGRRFMGYGEDDYLKALKDLLADEDVPFMLEYR